MLYSAVCVIGVCSFRVRSEWSAVVELGSATSERTGYSAAWLIDSARTVTVVAG